ncbi:MAG: hypothetical protein JRD02_04760, partial [Deltaproteobacteria bacterium]|nr:hypothetical protein [Deltaproteobacteria bacterium]
IAGITAGGDGTPTGDPSMSDPVPDVVTLNEQFQGGIVPEQGQVKDEEEEKDKKAAAEDRDKEEKAAAEEEEEEEKKRGRLICR